MDLIKTSVLSAFSTIIKILTGLVSVKIIAVFIGPTGIALLGQMQNFINMISNIASAGVNNGIIKYTAEFKDDEKTKQKIWSSSVKLSVILIIPMALGIIFFSKYLSFYLLKTTEYKSVFIIFAISIIFFVLNGFLTSILNGQGEIKKLTFVNISGNLIGLLVTILLVIKLKVYGALLAIIISQSIVFIVTLLFVIKSNWFKINLFLNKIDKEYTIKLLKFSLMALTSAIMVPISQMFIRDYIARHLGWEKAGYWQSVWRISETYLLLVTTTLSVYYLPKLSSLQEKVEIKKEILHGYKIIMPIIIISAFSIYIFRFLIIKILFSNKFLSIADLFLFQVIGDTIKISSWILAYLMVAKAMTKLFIATEIVFNILFVILSILMINIYGIIGVTIGYAINYLIYLLLMLILFKNYLSDT
jgi:PST family polysaccharide transporter